MKSVSLTEMFASIDYSAAPTPPPAKRDENVMSYDRAADMVKRFASDDAMVYRILQGWQPCPYLPEGVTFPRRDFATYKSTDPRFDAKDPDIELQGKIRLVVGRGSGYQNTRYLIDLIKAAITCRQKLMARFPDASFETRLEIRIFVDKVEARARFPISDSEAEALKNIALPSNRCQSMLAFPDKLAEVYEAEFRRLKTRPVISGQRLQR